MNASIMERGRFIRNQKEPANLAFWMENAAAVAGLFDGVRFEWVLGKDGQILNQTDREWIIPGRRATLWEYGPGKLGFTVKGGKTIESFRKSFPEANLTQNGDGEANFWLPWTPENERRLLAEAKPRLRRNRTGSK